MASRWPAARGAKWIRLVNWLLIASAGMNWATYRYFALRRSTEPTSSMAKAA